MRKHFTLYYLLPITLILFLFSCSSPISPGELATVHSSLEGSSNCTKCHSRGKKVSVEKCLNCHKEISERIKDKQGYHYSKEARDKNCIECHSDHHGKTFEIIHFDSLKFDHNLTGFELTGVHDTLNCKSCHKQELIKEKNILKKKHTYLGLKTNCLDCHEDYHQGELSQKCLICHDQYKFRPAPKFDHNNTNYKLTGKHFDLECTKCHIITIKRNRDYQQFKGLDYKNCVPCHQDKHKNKFGQECNKCHTVESFQIIKKIGEFDHNQTNYPLVGSHSKVNCKSCHKQSDYTLPIKHNLCKDCHIDYHNGQFTKKSVNPDCKECHNLNGFSIPLYTVDRHNTTIFPLKGAHVATPCLSCHKKTTKWSFRNIGKGCVDCHSDIHKSYLSEKYYPKQTCENCHNEIKWANIRFDHNSTGYQLIGMHQKQSCRACHYAKKQRFSELNTSCIQCHQDIHYKQFEVNGSSDCLKCHSYFNWQAEKFNHKNAAFKLDGKHINVACVKCHPETNSGGNYYTLYKTKKTKCEDCH